MRLWFLTPALGLALAINATAGEPLPTLYSPTPRLEMDMATLARQTRFAVLPAREFSRTAAESQSTAATTVALWSQTLVVGGVPYQYTMIGQDPFVVQAAPVYNITAYVIPITFTFTSFSNQVFSPTAPHPTCSPAGTALALTKASPIFNSILGNVWGTTFGTGQYVDLFQRANYHTQTNAATGINPNYHTTLIYKEPRGVSVPVSGGAVKAGGCGQVGYIDMSTWDSYIQSTIMPLLAAQFPQIAPPNSLVIFLMQNVVLFDGSVSNCCILGYHSAFNDPAYGGAFHTYVSAEFDTSQTFFGAADISPLSHEIAEWTDDPSGTNPTPNWGNVGQVSGCQANLEVGDPLTGTNTQIFMASNQYTYHVQELAFTSWFYGQQPSTGVNGWYSFFGTFLTPAAPCS